jgi:hypothetical protein
MSKETKNNKCAGCGKHIDKSACDSSWTTVITTKVTVCDDSEKGCHYIPGDRSTFCEYCAMQITKVVRDMKIAKIDKEVSQ